MEFARGLKQVYKTPSMYVHLQPGDGTRYEFIVCRAYGENEPLDTDNLYCTCLNIKFIGYRYHESSIREYVARVMDLEDVEQIGRKKEGEKLVLDHFIEYISNPAHSDCSPWTARAACMAMYTFLQMED